MFEGVVDLDSTTTERATTLDCAVDSVRFAREFFVGRDQVFWLDGGPDGVSLFGFGDVISGQDALKVIDETIRTHVVAPTARAGPKPGFVGWIPYGFTQQTIGVAVDRDGEEDRMSFIRAERIVQIDNRTGVIEIAVAASDADSTILTEWRCFVRDVIERAKRRDEPEVARAKPSAIWCDSDTEYAHKIARCQAEIALGNAYVLCLTTQVVALGQWSDVETFIALRSAGGSHHGALIRIGETSLVSASPERFIELSADRVVRTRPIKGTRRRSSQPREDLALRTELKNDQKERAENVMIVDLMRNDLARVCELGTVTVEKLFDVESYRYVHQLVSTVTGVLRDSVGVAQLIDAVFPAGSMTGAPKMMAARLLDRMESGPRGLYAGAFGFIGIDGTMDLAMTIRSVVIRDDRATLGTGGGITAMSDPESELEEIHLKAAASLAALRGRLPQRAAFRAGS